MNPGRFLAAGHACGPKEWRRFHFIGDLPVDGEVFYVFGCWVVCCHVQIVYYLGGFGRWPVQFRGILIGFLLCVCFLFGSNLFIFRYVRLLKF